MKQFTFIIATLFSLSSYSQLSSTITLETSAGVVAGINRKIGEAVKVSDYPYEIWKDTYYSEFNTRPAVQAGIGWFISREERPVAEISVGIHKGVDDFSPMFTYSRISAGLFHRNDFSIMPYTGVSWYGISQATLERKAVMTAGVQFLRWVEGPRIGRQSWFALANYTHRHITFTFGIKSHFK